MCASPYVVRAGLASDASPVLQIVQAAQDRLTKAGSSQQLVGYTRENVSARIERRELYVLEVDDRILGSAFVEPVTPERFPQIAGWNIAPDGCPVWFLYGLVIDPDAQGRGWGRVLLHSLCSQEAFAPPAVLTLDCWAGNQKLRRFYTDAGFQLHGVFPEEDYQIAVFTRPVPERMEAL